jgi:hypothetical protein
VARIRLLYNQGFGNEASLRQVHSMTADTGAER